MCEPNRIQYIDFLKFIGLTGIIIAHVSSPDWAMMLRNFDVPLMVILSSILNIRSYSNKHLTPGVFVYSRLKRLLIPTWIFLLFYFILQLLFSGKIMGASYYIYSFCLTRYGIGYVWIMLVFLYSALFVPFSAIINKRKYGFLFIIVLYILYELFFQLHIGAQYKIVDTTIYYLIPYGALTYLGCCYSNMKKQTKYIILCIACFLFIGLGIYYWMLNGAFQSVQFAKYPPRLYYMSYGVACSFALLIICENRQFKIYDNKLIRFVATHSMWIYLWHILILSAYDYMHFPEAWLIKLSIVYCSAAIIVVAQNKLLDLIEQKYTSPLFRYLKC